MVNDNVERLAVIDLGENLSADKIVIEVLSAYGIDKARIFEVRIY